MQEEWQALTARQRQGVSAGATSVFLGLLLGLFQPRFNGLVILAMFLVAVGLLAMLVALRRG